MRRIDPYADIPPDYIRPEALTKAEADALETKIDAQFEACHLPFPNLETARWRLCQVSEDMLRGVIRSAPKEWENEGERAFQAGLINISDRMKYMLRFAFDLCSRRLPATGSSQRDPLTEDNYVPTGRLIEAAAQFAWASRLFSAYHARSGGLIIDRDTGYLCPEVGLRRGQYNTLEWMVNADGGGKNTLISFAFLLNGPEFEIPGTGHVALWGPTVHEIVKRAKVSGGKVKYQLITIYARELIEVLDAEPPGLPDNWVFPWSNATQARAYYTSLQAICAYHLLSVHFGAAKGGLEGCGFDQLCLRLAPRDLNNLLARVSQLPLPTVEAITAALTYGEKTLTPDPAMQPLIPVGDQELGALGTMILSSNWSRNMLSLHARVNKKTFDAQSKLFELAMTERLARELPSRFPHKTARQVPTSTKPEDIDLVLVDEGTKTILFGELRWMLQPGDIREVLNRKQVIAEKVDQVARKVTKAQEALPKVLEYLGLTEGHWKILGAVVIEGYGGDPSPIPKEYPVVPGDIFLRAIKKCPNLLHAHAALCTPLWLPRRGIDFQNDWQREISDELTFDMPTFQIGETSYMQESLDVYLDEAFSMSVDALRSVPWN